MARMLIYEKATGRIVREALEPMKFDPAVEDVLYAPDEPPTAETLTRALSTAAMAMPTAMPLALDTEQPGAGFDLAPAQPAPPPIDARNYRIDADTGTLRPATPEEQAEWDADKLDAEEANQLDLYRMVRAIGWVLMQEINLLREAPGGGGAVYWDSGTSGGAPLPPRTKQYFKDAWYAYYRKLVP